MKKVNYLFVVLICAGTFCFCGCHNMCEVLEKNLEAVQWDQKLEWVDVADKATISSGSSTRYSSSMVDGKSVIKGTGSSGNWLFSGLGRDIKGFEGQVKIASGASSVGFQLFAKDSYAKYQVMITKDGKLNVLYNDGKAGTEDEFICKRKDIGVTATEYNTIKVEILGDRSTRVSVNGIEACIIPDHSLHYGQLAVIFGGSGTCYFIIDSIQH